MFSVPSANIFNFCLLFYFETVDIPDAYIFQCRPYNVDDKALIIGDAAHAVVPFYGQGMNAGFEDCTLLDQLFQKYNDNLADILTEFSSSRWRDTYAISDLAMYNYIEVRVTVYLFSPGRMLSCRPENNSEPCLPKSTMC